MALLGFTSEVHDSCFQCHVAVSEKEVYNPKQYIQTIEYHIFRTCTPYSVLCNIKKRNKLKLFILDLPDLLLRTDSALPHVDPILYHGEKTIHVAELGLEFG